MNSNSNWVLRKWTGSYADSLAAVGLAKLVSVLTRNSEHDVHIRETGDCFVISCPPVEMANWDYGAVHRNPLFLFVKLPKKEDESGVVVEELYDHPYYDYGAQKRLADILKEWDKKNKKSKQLVESDAELRPQPPDAKFFTFQRINMLQGFGARNKLFQQIRDSELEKFQQTVQTRLLAYAQGQERPEGKTPFCPDVPALQVFNPLVGKGTNRVKADGPARSALSSAYVDWFEEWLRFIGSDRILRAYQIGDDIKMSVPVPTDISLGQLIGLDVEKATNAWTSRKSDIFAVFDQVEFLINQMEQSESDLWLEKSPNEVISAIQTSYFKSLGSARSVLNISSLGLPGWFPMNGEQEYDFWQQLLGEHRGVLRLIDEEKSEESELLHLYREFLSSGSWRAFLQFLGGYGSFVMRRADSKKKFARSFTLKNLEELLMKSVGKTKLPIGEVINNDGFKAVASAMRKATVSEQFSKAKGNQVFDIHYGLFQEIKRKAKFREQVVERIAEFVTEYNFENARRAERLKEKAGRRRANVTSTELNELLQLFDEHQDHSETIAMLLIAFASASGGKDDTKQMDEEDGEDE